MNLKHRRMCVASELLVKINACCALSPRSCLVPESVTKAVRKELLHFLNWISDGSYLKVMMT